MKIRLSKNPRIFLFILIILAFCCVGIVSAAGGLSSIEDKTPVYQVEKNNKVIEYYSVEDLDTVEELSQNKFPEPNQKKTLSPEIKEIIDGMHNSGRTEITLTDEEKADLTNQGFAMEDIDYALLLSNEKQVADVEGLLKEGKELKQFKEKVKKEKNNKKAAKDVLDKKIEKKYKDQGLRKDQVQYAFSISKKYGVSLDEAIKAVKTGNEWQVFEKGVKQNGKK